MEKQKPTVGRIVHYFPGTGDVQMDEAGRRATAQAAIVVRVFSDECVNLHVFTDVGSTVQTSVLQGVGSNRWDWPPRS
jgi:hypothetical protein